jgi:hypothetical protein
MERGVFASELRRGDRSVCNVPVMSDYSRVPGELMRQRTLSVEIWLHARALM